MSELEETLAFQIRAMGLPEPEREYQAVPKRKFRYDFAWPDENHKLLAEVQGGIWIRGSHARPKGITRDMTKLNLAQLAGWRVLQFSPAMVRSGEAVKMIAKALGVEK